MNAAIDNSIGGARAKARCDELGTTPYSDRPDCLFRPFLGPGHRATLDRIATWMREAGMGVAIDEAGNLIGRYEGAKPEAPALLFGSHVDSVKDGGRYDGMLGVLLGIETIAAFHRKGKTFPFALEVIGFGDEEGSRFPTYMMGSRAAAGCLQEIDDAVADEEGIMLCDALADWGLNAAHFARAKRPNVLAYVEAHIEQAPHLERAGLPLGLVRGIASQYRYRVVFQGQAAHAGTAMHERRDALAASAEAIEAIERIGQRDPIDLVTTVGWLSVGAGAPNIVPGRVEFSVDIRAVELDVREQAAEHIVAALREIGARRGIELEITRTQELTGALCDTRLNTLLDSAIRATTKETPPLLVSQAGHDAMIMAHLAPMTMLFIRCAGGISHNPAESVESVDVEAAHRALVEFVERFGEAA
ncbi:allantoate amidohydrolase [Kozakia baliensis]|uniref:allantoate amidohydrolase n=1 Tax=Kozakia baliensis TaxID=153496 RepID=UPI000496B014|nr:allantoate amidohydrolase [Kozakia baliensis]AOX20806.1 Zn-dependent hydrolase [Kozakia baliensis]